MKAYKFKLLPTKAIQTRFEQTLNLCQELYNSALQERRDAWRLNRVSVNYHSQAIQLPEIKKVRPEFENIYSQVLQDVLRRVSKTFDNFFAVFGMAKKQVFHVLNLKIDSIRFAIPKAVFCFRVISSSFPKSETLK